MHTRKRRSRTKSKEASSRRLLIQALEARRLLAATPTTVSVVPNDATVSINTPISLVGRFADSDGVGDLRLAEFRVSGDYSVQPRCFVRYDYGTDLLKLYDDATGSLITVGSPGSSNSASNANCTLNALASSVSVVDANTLEVTVDLSFTSAIQGVRNIWMRAFDNSGTWSTIDDRGDITIVESVSVPPTTVAEYFDDRSGAMALNFDTELYLCGMIHSLVHGYDPSLATILAEESRTGWGHLIDDSETHDIPVSFNICGPEAVFGDAGRPEYAEIDILHPWHTDPHWTTNTWYSDAPPTGGDYTTSGNLSGQTRDYDLIYGGDLTERAMNSEVPFEISYHNFGHESLSNIDAATMDDTFRLGVEYHKRIGSKITAQAPPWNHNPQPSKYPIYNDNGIFAFNRMEGSRGAPYEVVEDLWVIPRKAAFTVNSDLTGQIDAVINAGHVLADYSHPWDGFENTDRTIFQNNLAYAKTKVESGELWATTLSEIARYWEAKSDVSSTTQHLGGKTVVDISLAGYDATLFGIPYLTFMSPMPDASSHAKITVDYPSNQTLNSSSSRIVDGVVTYTVYLNPTGTTHVEIEGVAVPYTAGVDINQPELSVNSTPPVAAQEATPVTIQATASSTDTIYSVNLIYQRNNDAKSSSIMTNNGGVWESTVGPFNAGDTVTYYVSVTDNTGNRERSPNKFFDVVADLDTQPPTWQSQGQSKTNPEFGTPVQLFAEGRDNQALRFARLETNETGAWAERSAMGSPIDMGDVSGTWVPSSFRWSNPALPGGTTVSWRIRYEDATGNETVTDVLSFVIQPPPVDGESPEYFDGHVDQFVLGESARFNLRATDNVGLDGYVFSFDDGSGTFVDDPFAAFAESVGEPWWDSDWDYRREIAIDNTANPAVLSDHTVLVVVDTAGPISAGKMNPQGGDLRFVDGATELDFWVESGLNTASTRIWVKVPNLPASATKQIFMYYGNQNRTVPRSQGTKTFPLFDDFGGSGWEPYKFSGNPVKGPEQRAGQGTFSSVIREDHDTWKMYSSFDIDGNDIGLSSSSDGLDWERDGVVLRKGSPGEWNSQNHWIPSVWSENGIYYMLHAASGPVGIQMGLATSTDGVNWTMYDDPLTTEAPYAESDPVFNDPFWATGDTESPCFSVLKEDGTYYVMYDTLRARRQASFATSTDLISWSPVAETPRFPGGPSTASWNYHTFCGNVFKFEDEYYLLMPGQDISRNYAKFGLYVSGSPDFPENDTEFKGIIMVGDPSGWENEDMDTPWVVMFDNKMYMYYAACGYCHSQTGLALINDVGLAVSQAYPPGNYIGVDRSITGSQRIMPPVGWSKSIAGYQEVDSLNFEITLDPAVTGRAVAQHDRNASKPLELYRNLPSMSQGVVSAWMRSDTNSTGHYDLYVYGDAQTKLAFVAGLSNSGTFKYWNGAFVDTGVSYDVDTWYRLELEFDVANNSYNFIVYDELFAQLLRVDGIQFGGAIASGIDQVKVRTSNSFNGTGYLDDVVVRPWTVIEPVVSVAPESSSQLTNSWARTTKQVPLRLGATIRWKYTTVDTSGNQTESEVFSFTFRVFPVAGQPAIQPIGGADDAQLTTGSSPAVSSSASHENGELTEPHASQIQNGDMQEADSISNTAANASPTPDPDVELQKVELNRAAMDGYLLPVLQQQIEKRSAEAEFPDSQGAWLSAPGMVQVQDQQHKIDLVLGATQDFREAAPELAPDRIQSFLEQTAVPLTTDRETSTSRRKRRR